MPLGDRAQPCGWWAAIIASQRRLSVSSCSSLSVTVPSAASLQHSGGAATPSEARCRGGAVNGVSRAAGRLTPSFAARRGRSLRAAARQGMPCRSNHDSRSPNSQASVQRVRSGSPTASRNHANIEADNCRRPICMHDRLRHTATRVNYGSMQARDRRCVCHSRLPDHCRHTPAERLHSGEPGPPGPDRGKGASHRYTHWEETMAETLSSKTTSTKQQWIAEKARERS